MQGDFVISGCFYDLEGLKCRKFLDIKRKGSTLKNPDLLVVMMNPGNSKPTDGEYLGDKVTQARPDRTQMQIMRLMDNCKLSYCRILNLTDIQEPHSLALYAILSKGKTKKMAHSIFDLRRQVEFDELYPKGTPTVFAWGVHDALTELAQLALDRLGKENNFGLQKQDRETAYYHPLPPNYHKQQQWIEQITQQLKTIQQF